jgi:hypothetical protein
MFTLSQLSKLMNPQSLENVEVNDSINDELKLDPDNPDYNRLVCINTGDQLTQAHQQSILTIHGGHEDAA